MRVLALLPLVGACYDPAIDEVDAAGELDAGADAAGMADAAGSGCVERIVPGAGESYSCAVRTDGSLWCWGHGGDGRLGNGEELQQPTPVPVSTLVMPTGLAPGGRHGCALDSDQLYCWGDNSLGQLGGDQPGADQFRPTLASAAPAEIVEVVSGKFTTCAISNGEAWCWGANDVGQAGRPVGASVSAPPAAHPSVTSATRLALGAKHACALAGGAVKCWGANDSLQLGSAEPTRTGPDPYQVTGFAGTVLELRAGNAHTCALVDSVPTSVACWGENDEGQLGDGLLPADSAVPVRLLFGDADDVAQLTVGEDHSCAMLASGKVWCWGGNQNGQCGDGVPGDRSVPVRATVIDELLPVTQVVALFRHTCVVTATHEAWCFGDRDFGALGDGNVATTPVFEPVQVMMPCP